jgi:hypothetical protein
MMPLFLCACHYIVHSRIGQQVLKHLLTVVGSAVIVSPACTSRKLVVAQHIEYAYGRETNLEQLRALGHASPNQKAAIRTSGYGQKIAAGIVLGNQVFSCGNEVVEYILLLPLRSASCQASPFSPPPRRLATAVILPWYWNFKGCCDLPFHLPGR